MLLPLRAWYSQSNAATGAVLATIPVGAVPTDVREARGTQKLYTSDEGSNQLSVISKETLSVIANISMGPRPHHMAASRDGKFVYAAEFGSNQIGVVDTETDTRVAGFATSRSADARAHALDITRNGRRLYATNEVTNDIGAIDAQSGELLWNLPVGNRPSEVLVSANGRTAYVTVRNEDKLKVVDLRIPEIVDETVVGTQPDTIRVTPDQETLVIALRGTPAQVALVDTETLDVTHVDIPGTTTGHHWLSKNGRYSFVAVEGPGSVAVMDNKSAKVLRIYPYPGGRRPHGVFFEPVRRH